MSLRQVLSIAAVASFMLCPPAHAQWRVAKYTVEVVRSYPHDVEAYTEGLFFLNGFLYESTGQEGRSSVRKVQLETGAVVQKHDVPARYFGEGIVNWKNEIVNVTWKHQTGFVYDLETFKLKRQFTYPGEGWALTQNGKHIIMSDGTEYLRFLDPASFKEASRLKVTFEGKPLKNINEIEWVEGEIYANVWLTDNIVRINPTTGAVVGLIDLRSLGPLSGKSSNTDDTLNGIAYDAAGKRLFVTGKRWKRLFEIRLVPSTQR
jgi:glutaminyl-peptide cyclotransferase